MEKKLKLVCMCAVIALSLLSCKKQEPAQPKTNESGNEPSSELKIAGGTAHLKVMADVANLLKKKNPELQISITGGGSGVGVKSVGEGMVDIGNSGRVVTPEEISQYGLVPHKIAIDGIAIVVHPGNEVTSLTLDEVSLVFAGEITNWKALGGEDKAINVYTRDAKSGTRKTFAKLATKDQKFVKSAIVASSNGNMKQSVSKDLGAIGYMSVGYLDDSVQGVAVDGIAPTLDNVKSGKYSIQRFLFSVTKGQPTGVTKQFLDLLLSNEGQSSVSKNFLIPVGK